MREKNRLAADKRCQYRNQRGEACRAARMHDSVYCFFHDPRARRSSRELARVEKMRMGKPSAIHQLLVEVVEAVRKKRMHPQQAYAVGWLVQLLMQNLAGLEHEASGYQAESYGRVFAGKVLELLDKPEEEAEGNEEATEAEVPTEDTGEENLDQE